jgi:hypothetical protein
MLKTYGDAEVTVSTVIFRVEPITTGSAVTGGFDT